MITQAIGSLNQYCKPSEFIAAFEQFAQDWGTWKDQANSTLASTCSDAAISTRYSAQIAAGQNFKGLWSSLSGALNTPASVYHNNQFWYLTTSLSNVTTKTPGVASEWVLFNWAPLTDVDLGPNVSKSVGQLVGINASGTGYDAGPVSPVTIAPACGYKPFTFVKFNDNQFLVAYVGVTSGADYITFAWVDADGKVLSSAKPTSIPAYNTYDILQMIKLPSSFSPAVVCVLISLTAGNQARYFFLDGNMNLVAQNTISLAGVSTGRPTMAITDDNHLVIASPGNSGAGVVPSLLVFSSAGVSPQSSYTWTGNCDTMLVTNVGGRIALFDNAGNLRVYTTSSSTSGYSLLLNETLLSGARSVYAAANLNSYNFILGADQGSYFTRVVSSGTSLRSTDKLYNYQAPGQGVGTYYGSLSYALLGSGKLIAIHNDYYYNNLTNYPGALPIWLTTFDHIGVPQRTQILLEEKLKLANNGNAGKFMDIPVVPVGQNGFAMLFVNDSNQLRFLCIKDGSKLVGAVSAVRGNSVECITDTVTTVATRNMLNHALAGPLSELDGHQRYL